eukprot:Skav224796  [mRNA]  locus=scaffold764:549767:550186:- [translate_table: standard]
MLGEEETRRIAQSLNSYDEGRERSPRRTPAVVAHPASSSTGSAAIPPPFNRPLQVMCGWEGDLILVIYLYDEAVGAEPWVPLRGQSACKASTWRGAYGAADVQMEPEDK